MKIKLLTAPTEEPVTLAQAKAYAKITHPLEDAIIPTLIAGARKTAEDYTRMSFVRQKWLATYEVPKRRGHVLLPDDDSIEDFDRIVDGAQLKRGPVAEIVAVRVSTGSAPYVVMPPEHYFLDGDVLRWNSSVWPFFAPYDHVQVEYHTGEATAAEFVAKHSSIVDAILMVFTHRFENRGFSTQAMPIEAQVILNAYWKPHH